MTPERAAAFRSLAATLRAGSTMRNALVTWDVPVPEVARLSERIRLGCPVGRSLEQARSFLGGDLGALHLVTELQGRVGGDAAAMLEEIARSIDRRVAAAERGKADAAGAHLSARMVAGLPLAALLFLPGSRAPVFDPMGLVVIALGVGLCLVGMRWMSGLLPKPPDGADDVGLLAVVVASATRGGCEVDQVLDLAACHVRPPGLVRAARLHRLGLPWREALLRSEEESLRSFGAALAASQRVGAPVATALEGFARRRAEHLQLDLERAIRRAPVRMVVPLTLCVLPSFALLALTPFLRSLVPA